MIEFAVGVFLAIIVAVSSTYLKFDRDISFHSTLLTVIASYYILFSFLSMEAIWAELSVSIFFIALAFLGAIRLPLLIGIGLILHGIFDLFHSSIIDNSGVPSWWPLFCMAVDVVLGLWFIYLVKVKKYF